MSLVLALRLVLRLRPSLPALDVSLDVLPPPGGGPPQGDVLHGIERFPGPAAVHELRVASATAILNPGGTAVYTTVSSLALSMDAVLIDIRQLRQIGNRGSFALTFHVEKPNISADVPLLL